MPFVHLRTHTEFSVVDGTLRIDDAAARARRRPAGAGDHRPVEPVRRHKFYKACRGKGVKPMIGADVFSTGAAAGGEKQPSRLLLLVQNRRAT